MKNSSFRIIYLPSAKQNLREIALYLSQFYENTFEKFMNQLDKSVSHLEEMPHMGMIYKDFRRLVVDDYLIFYKVDEKAQEVRIYRILHGSQNLDVKLVELVDF